MELDFEKLAGEAFLDPENYLTAEEAISPELAGLRYFDPPIFGVADAADPMFEGLRGPEAIGPHFRLPTDWLPEARRVVSFFLPYSQEVKRPNEAERREPSASWLHGRIEGHRFLLQFARKLRAALEEGGERALIPPLEKEFAAVEHDDPDYAPFGPGVAFTSNWSERHVAHICGLGTFGLSKGLITEKGICGRFGSVVTTAELPIKKRPYIGLYEYCTFCGACMKNCPVNAISPEEGKKHPPCSDYLDVIREKYAPRYGCGKCQVKVPCRDGIPPRRKKD